MTTILQCLRLIMIAFALLFALLLLRSLRRQRHSTSSNSIDNVPAPKSSSWLRGNYQQIFNSAAWPFHEFLRREYGSIVRLHGPFGASNLYTFDPEAMHHVLFTEHNVFDMSDGFIVGNRLSFGGGFFGTPGHEHRKQRKMLNPVFSVAHLRDMVPTFFEITHKLETALKRSLQSGSQTEEIDILSWMGRTSLEIIGQAGLGYSLDPLTDEKIVHPYSRTIKKLVPTLMRVQFWRMNVLPRVVWIGSPGFRRLVVNLLPWKDVHHIRDIVDYMWEVATEIYESKKRAFKMGDEAVAQQIGRGKDIISVLMRANMKALKEEKIQDKEVISQMSSLIFAATDTTSTAMARVLNLLAQHPDAQDRLRQEIIEAKHQLDERDLSFEELNALPYLDAVCRETLRLFPPVSTVFRVARQDTALPLQKSITGLNGTEIRQVMVPKGTIVFLSIFNANRNPELWGKDSEEWKPERWLSPLSPEVVNARIPGVYSHLMTFIGGGRSCIGFKFAELEMKVVISTLVERFKFSPSTKELEICWQMNNITTPILSGKDNHPQLPINVSLVD
ncbi:cytochrome P450 [Lentinula boryana]|uniref:Cytochrome P450 n=1 Tax=Lentinula boryana TaxID=40481 RepID=A0ABQ8Q3R1_9AGAR|nr:cytochrome P450 [Lentinula boryana]